jgi:hypothetical protein
VAYSDFTLAEVTRQFQLKTEEDRSLYAGVAALPVSELLAATLAENVPLALAIGNEKARSEMIVVPILIELRRLCDRRISLHSGLELNVDPAKGLTGVCDYILARSTEQFYLTAPVAAIVYAKMEDIYNGPGQCAAAMVAARFYNEREGNDIPIVHGMVTTGSNWRAMALEGQVLRIDSQEYYVQDVGKVLGIMRRMVE